MLQQVRAASPDGFRFRVASARQATGDAEQNPPAGDYPDRRNSNPTTRFLDTISGTPGAASFQQRLAEGIEHAALSDLLHKGQKLRQETDCLPPAPAARSAKLSKRLFVGLIGLEPFGMHFGLAHRFDQVGASTALKNYHRPAPPRIGADHRLIEKVLVVAIGRFLAFDFGLFGAVDFAPGPKAFLPTRPAIPKAR